MTPNPFPTSVNAAIAPELAPPKGSRGRPPCGLIAPVQSTVQVILALVLGAAALTRVGRPRATQRALATFGIPDGAPRSRARER